MIGASIITVDAMNIEIASQAEAGEEILTFDIPDAVLERAGSAEQTAFTLLYCTNQSSECGFALHSDLAPPATHCSNFRALEMNPQ